MTDKEKFTAACRASSCARHAYKEAIKKYTTAEVPGPNEHEVNEAIYAYLAANAAFDAALAEFRGPDEKNEDIPVVAGLVLSEKAIQKMKEREDVAQVQSELSNKDIISEADKKKIIEE